jgi:outer membrane lipoprotein-sorting protein
MRRLTLIVAIAASLTGPARAQSAETSPAEPLAVPSPQQVLAPETQELLDRMDEAGRKIETLQAQFDYELNQTLYEDVQKRKGKLLFRAPNLLSFEFTDRPRETFVFDGRILYHKKDATKQLIIWEIRRAEEPALDSFELGKTPFPMPFGQKKEAVLKHFDVTRDAAEESRDKENRGVLVLKPKKDTPLAETYTAIALWVEAKTFLPTRARLWDTSENITTIDFHSIVINKNVDAKMFARPEVPEDWEIVHHAKEPEAPAKPAEDNHKLL